MPKQGRRDTPASPASGSGLFHRVVLQEGEGLGVEGLLQRGDAGGFQFGLQLRHIALRVVGEAKLQQLVVGV